MKKYQQEYNTPYQLKFPIEIEKIIETIDPVYTFCEVIDHIDLNKYLTTEERRTGRPRYDEKTLLKVILFAFMENGLDSSFLLCDILKPVGFHIEETHGLCCAFLQRFNCGLFSLFLDYSGKIFLPSPHLYFQNLKV